MTQDIEEQMAPLQESDKDKIRTVADSYSEQRIELIINRMVTGESFEDAEKYSAGSGY